VSGQLPASLQAGDILAIRGTGFFARGILAATGNTVSHVGMVLAPTPGPLVIEALWRVKTRPLSLSIQDSEKAYILSDLSLTPSQRETVVLNACKFSADGYGWWDIGLQAADAVCHTTFFTGRLSWGLNSHPICSYLVAEAYVSLGLTFGRKTLQSITPADIFNFALQQPDIYTVTEIK